MTRPRFPRNASLLAILVGLLIGSAAPAAGQNAPRAALGAGLGVLGGVGITIANVVARAHWQDEYLLDLGDLIHWQSLPMILAPATGAVFGLHSREALQGSFVGAVSGLGLGAGLGALIGRAATAEPEGPWAGGVIGGGLGLAIGGLLGGYIGMAEHERLAPSVALEVRVPASRLLPAGPW